MRGENARHQICRQKSVFHESAKRFLAVKGDYPMSL